MATTSALTVLGQAGTAWASEPPSESPYGEVRRFGGFDETGLLEGKFVLPVGFAVDGHEAVTGTTPDGNAVYVLDRVANEKINFKINPVTEEEEYEETLGYRLQKLSSSGTVLGTARLPTEIIKDIESFTDAHPLISLAVDSNKQRVYALVESVVNDGEGNCVPVARELVAWSTVPNDKKELVAPEGYPPDSVTGAGLVASASSLQPASIGEDLYAPEALTVDPATHNVMIEAQHGLSAGPTGGPTILQPVITEGAEEGKLATPWVADTAKTAPKEEPGDGLFTANDGTFGIDLFVGKGSISRLADVQANFAKPEPKAIAEDTSGGRDLDQAPSIDNSITINRRSGHIGGGHGSASFEPYAAGSPVTQLTNNLYAARYAHSDENGIPPDPQSAVTPWSNPPGLEVFWVQALSNAHGKPAHNVANEGIRLFNGEGHIVTTIGGQEPGQPCSLDTEQLAVAAGANGSLFVLTQPNWANNYSDDQVIEFAPGGTGKCPQPTGGLQVNGKTGSSFTVTTDKAVKFEASSINRAGETPYEYDWYFEGNEAGGKTYEPGSKMAGPNYTWPNPIQEHNYTKTGMYEASVRLIGDYGTSVFNATIHVTAAEPALAEFTPPSSAIAGEPAVFDASASKPIPGIIAYHWEWGDGTSANTNLPQQLHTFTAAQTYHVKLKITDEAGETAETAHDITVAAAKPATPEETLTQPVGSGTLPLLTTTGQGGGTPPPPPKGDVIKPLTKAQKLTLALKNCHKLRSKHRRATCEQLALKKYGPKRKSTKSTKKK